GSSAVGGQHGVGGWPILGVGPGRGLGGGIYNAGTMTLSGCTLAEDSAIDVDAGSAIYNAGTMTVSGCTLSFDQADSGYGLYNAGTLTVGTSTFVWTSVAGPYTDAGGNLFITGRPQIGSVTASSSTVSAGDSLTLTVSDVTDPNPGASITQVLFYV